MQAVLVHGGAGRASQDSLPLRRQGCEVAAQAAWRVLEAGGSAVAAVEAAVAVLEDNPLFNAGIGSALTRTGEVETDAAIMDGATLAAGGVAAVSHIRNPIRLARAVMELSPHVLIAGEGARQFARTAGISECDPRELVVPAQRARWDVEHGTVGCVALDAAGRLAAGTSTGGIHNKLPGRVGDSPLIGAGTYADAGCAVSCTGDGEGIIRTVLARQAAWFLETDRDATRAAERSIAYFAARVGGEAGLILLDERGTPGYASNSVHMPVGWVVDGVSGSDI